MKKTKTFAAVLLAAILLTALSGCAGMKKSEAFRDSANEKVIEFLDLCVQRDMDAQYAMLYPDVIDRDSFETVSRQIYDYCPVAEGYELKMQTWEVYSKLGGGDDTIQITYELTVEGELFYVSTVYKKTEDGEGFVSFSFVSQADKEAAEAAEKKG